NLEAKAGRPLAAVAQYERAHAVLPLVSKYVASFNLGAARFSSFQMTLARTAFLTAIDGSTDPNATALAWWWVGRTYLDAGCVPSARGPLRKAITLAQDSELRVVASLGLATACLAEGDRSGAHAALVRQRNDIRNSQYRAFGAIVDQVACIPQRSKKLPQDLI